MSGPSEGSQRSKVNRATILHAAELCKLSYESEFESTPGSYCRINQFWLPGEIFGFIEFDANDAFVFRGTDSQHNKGNWVFTNFQAYRRFPFYGIPGQLIVPAFTLKLSKAIRIPPGAKEPLVPRSRLTRVGTIETVSEPKKVQPLPVRKKPESVEPVLTSRN
jgi:hypothetical protein